MEPTTAPPPTQTPPQPAPPEMPPPNPAPTPMPSGPTPPPTDKKGYGKRPKWQWAVIYVVAAIVVYGLVYYFFIRKSGTSASTSGY